jgi:hypothetical protein
MMIMSVLIGMVVVWISVLVLFQKNGHVFVVVVSDVVHEGLIISLDDFSDKLGDESPILEGELGLNMWHYNDAVGKQVVVGRNSGAMLFLVTS